MKAWQAFLSFSLTVGTLLSFYAGTVAGVERGVLILTILIPIALLFTKLGIAFEDYGK